MRRMEQEKQELRRLVIHGVEQPVVLNPEARRFEVVSDGELAKIDFRRVRGGLALVHTEVPPAFKGQRVGDGLARAALDFARAQQFIVEPYCPFVRAFIGRHAEYADLVPPTFVVPADESSE